MGALIFDFDGVIADSEVLGSRALAEYITELGFFRDTEYWLSRYVGLRWADAIPLIEKDTGLSLPDNFPALIRGRIHEKYESELQEVEGVSAFLLRFAHVPRCIASSSSLKGLAHALELLDLNEAFGSNVFSAEQVARGKPHPDLFLFAASQLGVARETCLVIEDSVNGVKAAVAAGMTAVGLCAGSHIRDGHSERLKEAGAVYLAQSWPDVADIARDFLRSA